MLGEILSQMLNVPVMTGLLVLYLYFRLPADTPNRLSGFLIALLFLSIIPLCSLFFYIPGKEKEQEKIFHRQRVASFVFMAVSYPAGALALYLMSSPRIFTAMAISYTLITLGLIIFNLFAHYKASGHAAGVAGPVASLIYLYGWMASPLLALLPLVTWARVMAKGHTTWQMIVGAALSLSIAVAVLYVYGFTPFTGHLY
jgi:hypothetical protein